MKRLRGTFVVMVTPFKENEDLDEKEDGAHGNR